MDSKYSYNYTEKAEQDFDEILRYISFDSANPIAAQNLGRQIFEKFDEVTEEKMIIAKEAITNALAHPYEITKSEFASFGDKPIVMDNLNIDEHIAAVGGEHVE